MCRVENAGTLSSTISRENCNARSPQKISPESLENVGKNRKFDVTMRVNFLSKKYK